MKEALERLAGKSEIYLCKWRPCKITLYGCKYLQIYSVKKYLVAKTHHSSAWGAAWTALVATGRANTFEKIKHGVISEKYLANTDNHLVYQEVYKKYKEVAGDIFQTFLMITGHSL